MHVLDAPEINGFLPYRQTTMFGEPVGVMINSSRVRLFVTQAGIVEINNDPTFTAQVNDVAEAIARYDGFQPPRLMEEVMPVHAIRRACNRTKYGYAVDNPSSVYEANDDPHRIIKAFDLDILNGPEQFGLMNHLHAAIASRAEGIGLASPAQLVMLEAPLSGHKTTIMSKLGGIELKVFLEQRYPKPGQFNRIRDNSDKIHQAVVSRATALLDASKLKHLNDLHNRNIFIDEAANPEAGLEDIIFGLIDQPNQQIGIRKLITHPVRASRIMFIGYPVERTY
jgi:hypothetical protein